MFMPLGVVPLSTTGSLEIGALVLFVNVPLPLSVATPGAVGSGYVVVSKL